MKVIFLDVDGVLNSYRSYKKTAKHLKRTGEDIVPLEDHMFELLASLVKETGAKIVLSSAWRSELINYKEDKNHEWMTALLNKFKEFGIPYDLSRTPLLYTGYRGSEIGAWLFSAISRGENIESFVILDDDDDMAPLKQFFVQTCPYTGLRPKNIKRAKFILDNYKFDPEKYEKHTNIEGAVYFIKKLKIKG